MTVQIDTREKGKATVKIRQDFDKAGISYFRSKMYVGDYMDIDNTRFCIDRKQNLNELCKNLSYEHKRFIEVLDRARRYGIRMVFLVEHSANIKTLDDVKEWKNPRLKTSPLAMSGERLYKILSTLEKTYNTKFYFCTKAQTGERIIELFNENRRNIQ